MALNSTNNNRVPYQLAKQLRLGGLLYRLYHLPKSKLQKVYREGPLQVGRINHARRMMERSTHLLPPAHTVAGESPLEIYFLSGRRFWYQTSFCAHSFMQHAGVAVRPVIFDDGTLDGRYVESILRVLPGARIVSAGEINERLDTYLPSTKFPTLRARRLVYPHLRKLTDIHVGAEGWKLVLDSDMLFFRRADFLLDWLHAPTRPVYMLDVESAYGYSDALMRELAGAPIAERLNVGVCGLRSDAIDWERLENWCRIMLDREGSHYYQEQALTAMLMAGQTCAVAPEQDYIINPDRASVTGRRGVLHHYVAESKTWYFRYAWKAIVGSA